MVSKMKKINLKNEQQIRAKLQEVAGQASRYMLTDPETLREIAREAEEISREMMLKASELQGMRVEYVSASSPYNRAWGGSACSRVVLERGARGWFLISAEKVHRDGKKPRKNNRSYTEKQKQAGAARCFPLTAASQ